MITLALPQALALLPLPWLAWYLLPRKQAAVMAALRIPFFDAMVDVVQQEHAHFAKPMRLVLPALAWALLVLALAGPLWVGAPQPVVREGRQLLLALDLSLSMEIRDMRVNGRPVSRLAVVKQAAQDFVRARTGDKIGLILFGTRAYLQTPLTYDRQNVLQRIDDATAGLAGQTTSIGDALGLAVKRLREAPAAGRVIILLTDGVNNSGVLAPRKAAELAQAEGIKIYTIGLGADSDLRNFFANNGAMDLDEATLKAIAQQTGGQYFRATDTHSLQTIYQTINQLEAITEAQATVRPQKEYYPYCAGLALLCLLAWLGRRELSRDG